jgi:glycosyltransferase involved in cell wall biosynthesis
MISENLMQKRRFCLIGPSFPYRGGISHYNTCLALELAKRHDVRVVNFKRLYPDFLFPGKTQYDESGSPLRMSSELLIDSVNPLTWIRTGFHVARQRPDVVLVQWWHPFFAPALFTICSIVKMLRRGSVMFICHNVVPHETSLVDRVLSRFAFAAVDMFIVHSGQDRENLLGMRGKATVAVNPLPSFDFFRAGTVARDEARRVIGEDGGGLVLFFGYIRPYKGLIHLIEAMSIVRKRYDARLLVVGEFYEDSGPYRRRVEELGLSASVRFVDRYVGNEEVGAFFAASDLVVLPYVSATQSAIAQIALSFDRPVVVTDVGGLPELVSQGKTGFIAPPADPEALAGTITEFFLGGWAVRMEPYFAGEKKRFSWSSLVSRIEALAGLGEE